MRGYPTRNQGVTEQRTIDLLLLAFPGSDRACVVDSPGVVHGIRSASAWGSPGAVAPELSVITIPAGNCAREALPGTFHQRIGQASMINTDPSEVLPNAARPSFIITVDTEGDNSWSHPTQITTRNAGYLQRFQTLCESHGFRPTYLVNYEMAICPVFKEFGRDVLKRNVAEIGMHLHAWNSPPLIPLTADDFQFHPYLIEYPGELIVAKVTQMTDLLEDTFGEKMVSHRAGRWAFNEEYARILAEHGYKVDSSVTPYYSWKKYPGDPRRRSGTDYYHFGDDAYFLDLEDISRPGRSTLLEVPVTIIPVVGSGKLRKTKFLSPVLRTLDKVVPPRWLRARPDNLKDLRCALQKANRENRHYIQYCLHSSELMPGGSPKFPEQAHIDNLYHDMEILFTMVHDRYEGVTLKEYHNKFIRLRQTG
jgi:hypothetical protein